MSLSLENRTVLVVGRPSGIASATVQALAAAGAEVILAGRTLDPVNTGTPETGSVRRAQVDLTDESSIAALAASLGKVDHVVSTASARARGALTDLKPETIALSFATKVTGPILLAKHFAPLMPADGSFVFFSGQSAQKPMPGMLAVGATNGAVDVVVRSLAVEVAPIRVNAISPGTIDTGAYDGLGAEKKAAFFADRIGSSPAARIGTAEDIAAAVLFALTNSFVTGHTLPVDGGEALV
ncbi:SDR family oxidoreductase [Kribbella sp. DT2]|uniref:SDR family oxidoreductase n=1 Tax=Kribbella sp. DT2 TaxID=3393427 RepID=UPI003CF412B6